MDLKSNIIGSETRDDGRYELIELDDAVTQRCGTPGCDCVETGRWILVCYELRSRVLFETRESALEHVAELDASS